MCYIRPNPWRTSAGLLGLVMLLSWVSSTFADPKPLTREEQQKVDKAIDDGVAFLKHSQLKQGDWPWKKYKNSYLVGECALPAYALLESGVPGDKPTIERAAAFIRQKVVTDGKTYDLSLAILFLDRLGDPKDKKLIQSLALRLVAGQHHTGGWSYCCPLLSESGEQNLLRCLTLVSKEMREGGKTREQALARMAVPLALQSLPAFQSARNLQWQESGTSNEASSLTSKTDNSNTQFAILGLWVARRNGVPLEPTFELLVRRFECSQAYPSGAWSYWIDGGSGSQSPSMICVGLKGLAIGRGLKLRTDGSPIKGEQDVHVLKGLSALSRRIGKPANRMDRQTSLPDYYFLWSVERVAMLYGLETIGEKDWYRWGAEALVTNQAKNGAWTESAITHTDWNKKRPVNYSAVLNTAFALLFLKRSHPMKDLTPKLPLTGKKLTEGLARLGARDKFPIRPVTAPSISKTVDPPNPGRPGEKPES